VRAKARPAAKSKQEALSSGDNIDVDIILGEELKWLEHEAENLEAGYLAMNVLDPPKGAEWGRFNEREVKKSWIEQLVKEFPNKLHNCRNVTAMFLGIRKSWIKNENAILKSVSGMDVDKVPLLELTPEAEELIKNKKEKLWMMSGNHRRVALGQFIGKKKARVEELKKTIAKHEERKKDAKHAVESEAAQRRAKDELDELEREIDIKSRWVVRLYDRGERSVSWGSRMSHLEGVRVPHAARRVLQTRWRRITTRRRPARYAITSRRTRTWTVTR
jgi:hypothetical protein